MSDFHDVRETFTSELVVFGLAGAERVVNDFAIEAEAAEELAQSANGLDNEEMGEISPISGLAEMVEIVCFIDELVAESILARRRHAYANELLERARKEADED